MAVYGSSRNGAFVGFKPGGTYSTAGDDLLFQMQLAADDKFAKLQAAAKPDLGQYAKDLEKLKALPGEKEYLQLQYLNTMSGLKRGAEKHGGWLSYSSTDDFHNQLNRLQSWAYNTAVAEQNFNNMEQLRKNIKPEQLDLMYLDANHQPVPTESGSFMTNAQYLDKVSTWVNPEDGRLTPLPITLNPGDASNFIDDVNKIAANLGHTKSETPYSFMERLIQTSTGAQQILQSGSSTRTSNARQLEAAAQAIRENLSSEGLNGIFRDYYRDRSSGRIKKDSDFNDYLITRAKQALAHRQVSEVTNQTSITKLGDGDGESSKSKRGYFAALWNHEQLITEQPIPMRTTAVDKNGKVSDIEVTRFYPQQKNETALSSLFKPGSQVNRPFSFKGITYDEIGGEGMNRAIAPKNLKYGRVLDVGSVYVKQNPTTGRFDQIATNEELYDAGLLTKPGEPLQRQKATAKGIYKLVPVANVEMKATVSDITEEGRNLYVLNANKNNRSKILADNFLSNYFSGDTFTGGDSYLSNEGVQLRKHDPRSLNVDDSKDEWTSLGQKTAEVTFVATTFLTEGDLFEDGKVAEGYSSESNQARMDLINFIQSEKQKSALTMQSLYGESGK